MLQIAEFRYKHIIVWTAFFEPCATLQGQIHAAFFFLIWIL